LAARTAKRPGPDRRPVLDFLCTFRARTRRATTEGCLARSVEQLDWGLALALALGLLAATPFLARAGLPRQTDAELHVYRTAELHRIVHQGVVYPRWAADLYLGYGYPIFNYYAPLTYHLGSLFATVLPGVDIVAATKMVFVLGLVLASLGAYLLGRALFEPAGGILAAASFTLSPYVLFIDPHARGDLAEHFAVCLVPLAFFFVHRLMEAPGPGVLLGSVFSVSAIVFSHNLMGLTASALLLGYWVWRLLLGPERTQSLWALLAFALAAGLIAFFWLPALLERDAVKLEVIGPGHFDFRQHFLGLRELLAPSRLLDWGATGPRFRHNLGLARWVLAVPALAVLARRLHRPPNEATKRHTAFFLAGALGLTFLMLRPAADVWDVVPAMPYLQFPWRLLGPTNVMLAVCAASATALLPKKPWRRWVLAGSLALALLAALPLLYPPPWPARFGGTSPLDIIRWERDSQALGTTSTGDFLPATVEMIPSPAETLIQSYEGHGPVDKVNRATLPEGAEVTILSHAPDHDRFRVSTSDPFVLRLYTFLFPGWRAYVDGRQVEIEIARPEGFITVPVPQGEHTVLVRFESTPARRAGWMVSIVAAILLVAVPAGWGAHGVHRRASAANLSSSEGLWLGGTLALVLLLVGSTLVLVDPQGWLHLNSPPGEARPAQHEVEASFEGMIELLGYDLPRTQVRPGETVPLVLYWRALSDVKENYQSFVHLAQPLDTVWGQEDHLNPGGLPTRRWPRDKYVWDAYEIYVRPETPPGAYSLNVGLYLRSEGYRLKRVGEDGRPVGDSLVIDTVTVTE
jgi:hypothetical protein